MTTLPPWHTDPDFDHSAATTDFPDDATLGRAAFLRPRVSRARHGCRAHCGLGLGAAAAAHGSLPAGVYAAEKRGTI